MKIYLSLSSNQVRVITLTAVMLSIMICFSVLFGMGKAYHHIVQFLICGLVLGSLLYFYLNSLKKVCIKNDKVILIKKLSQIDININDIHNIQLLSFSNLSMTVGSKGVFRYIGSTMGNCMSLVKDRKNMLRIDTAHPNYIF